MSLFRALFRAAVPRKGGENMAEPGALEYFYGTEAEQYTFYRIPKVLFTDPGFKQTTGDAKILYGLMLDRMGLSIVGYTHSKNVV